jgi:hypothetical protein
VRQEVQWYLTEALANARARIDISDAGQTLANYSGALGAFRYLNELTQDEERDWRGRMRLALEFTPPAPAAPGTSQAVYVGDPNLRSVPDSAPGLARFVRYVSGPNGEFERHGGRLRVIAAEIYDTKVAVRWRFAPEPDISSAFPAETAQLAHDLEGTEGWAADELRKKAQKGLHSLRLYRFGLSDDIGTDYRPWGGSSGGGGGETTGEAMFLPAPPPAASALIFTWMDLSVEIPLS